MTITVDRPMIGTREISCSVSFAPNLRKTLQDYSPEVTLLYITSDTGAMFAQAGNIIYRIDCEGREGDIGSTRKDVIVGLRFYTHDKVPGILIDSNRPSGERYALRKLRRRTHLRRYITEI